MRPLLLALPLFAAACVDIIPVPEITPDRAIWKFNGDTVTIQSKTPLPNDPDIALARSACPGAEYASTLSVIGGVSTYLFIC